MHGYIVSYSPKYARWHHGSVEMSPGRLLGRCQPMRSSYYNNQLRIIMIKSIHIGHFYEQVVSFYATYICAGIRNLKPRYYISCADHFGVLGQVCPKRRHHAGSLAQTLTERQRFHELQMTIYDKNHTIIRFYEHVVSFHAMCLKL